MPAESQTATTPIEKIEHILAQKLEQGDLELPLLPQVASHVMALTSNPAADAAKLSSLIHQDQALAAHVLRTRIPPPIDLEVRSLLSNMPSPCWELICFRKSPLPPR
jgi:hypothetical protein